MAVDAPAPAQLPVTVSLHDLQAGTIPFPTLVSAFGPSSLGILIVSDLPSTFPALRAKVLSCSSHLAALPPSDLQHLECASANYLIGWSRGRETLRSGHYDTFKGSFYMNCPPPSTSLPEPSTQPSTPKSAHEREPDDSFPEYTHPNILPPETVLPGFRSTFEDLCSLIIDTAVLVAGACDRYAEQEIEGYAPGTLAKIVRESRTTKARLLHYYPRPSLSPSPSPPTNTTTAAAAADGDQTDDNWCATHLDHGCLTGLTSAFFTPDPPPPHTPAANVLPELPRSPDPKAGLYIHSRSGATVKVNIPRDCLAFQTGEALEILTRGKFRAVPHFVRGAKTVGEEVARNTLAVFTQPNLDVMLDEKRSFGGFSREVVGRNT